MTHSVTLRWSFAMAVVFVSVAGMTAVAEECTHSDAEERASSLLRPLAIDNDDPQLLRLQKERFNAAVEDFDARHRLYQIGKGSQPDVEVLERIARAAADCFGRKDYVRVLKECVDLAKSLEASARERHANGVIPFVELQQAIYSRADLDIRWFKAKHAAGDAPK